MILIQFQLLSNYLNRNQEILEHKHDYDHRSFAFCKSCYWMASLFTRIDICKCPVCHRDDVELMPLDLHGIK